MKELVKKYKEVESKRNAIAAKNSECREKLRILKADDSRHELAVKELQQTRQKTSYCDFGELEKKIAIHKNEQEKLMDKIGDSEYVFSTGKRQLLPLDSELAGIKRQLFGAIADDLVKQVTSDTKTNLLQIYAAIKMSGLRPAPQEIFDMLFGKNWDHVSLSAGIQSIQAGILKKYNLT